MKKVVLVFVGLVLLVGVVFCQDWDSKILQTKANLGDLSIQEKQLQNRLAQIQQAYSQQVQELSDLLNQKQQEEMLAANKKAEEEANKKAEEEANKKAEEEAKKTAVLEAEEKAKVLAEEANKTAGVNEETTPDTKPTEHRHWYGNAKTR